MEPTCLYMFYGCEISPPPPPELFMRVFASEEFIYLLYGEPGVCLLRCEQDHRFIWKVEAGKRMVNLKLQLTGCGLFFHLPSPLSHSLSPLLVHILSISYCQAQARSLSPPAAPLPTEGGPVIN